MSTNSGGQTAPGHAAGTHDPDVHVFETVGIEEGNAKVPRWYLIAMLLLVGFCAVYIGQYLFGAQPSAAQLKQAK